MSHDLGAGHFDAAQRASYAGTTLILFIMSLAALAYWIIPQTLISVDINLTSIEHEEIIKYAIVFFAIAGIYQLFEAARICVFGALRAHKDTTYTLITSLISFWGIALPVGYFLSTYGGLKGAGFWWGMVVGGVAGLSFLLYRLQTKRKAALSNDAATRRS